jgi:hypothetical protein
MNVDSALPQQRVRAALPVLIAGPGDRAALRFIEFFTVTTRNRNTRAAYAAAAAAEGQQSPALSLWRTFWKPLAGSLPFAWRFRRSGWPLFTVLLRSSSVRVDNISIVKHGIHSAGDDVANLAHVGLPECFVLRGMQALADGGVLNAENAFNLVLDAEKLIQPGLDGSKHRDVQWREPSRRVAEFGLSLRPRFITDLCECSLVDELLHAG